MSDSKRWIIQNKSMVYSNKLLSINEMACHLPSKNIDNIFYGIHLRNWVNIFAMTKDGKIILVKQHRLGGNEMTVEVPAGTIDCDDEDPKDAAIRELQEETGYVAKEMILLNKIKVNPAIQDNFCYFYFAKECELTNQVDFDETEDIDLIVMDKEEVFSKIFTDFFNNSLTLQAIMFGKMYLDQNC